MSKSAFFVEAASQAGPAKPLLTANPQPRVSVVLLSYNRPSLLKEALASVFQQSFETLDVTVVDNPSPASSDVARIVSRHPNVKLVQPPINLGYTGGMNRGIEQASGDYVLLTEDDIVLENDCIQRLVEFSEANPEANLIAPIIYNRSEKTIRCAGGSVTLGSIYHKVVFGAGELDRGQFSQSFAVNYIDGAVMFASRNFWEQFKGFREEYFMYVDAVELCARVAKAGKGMMIVPQAKVYHFEPASDQPPAALEFHKLKNFFSLYLLHAPARVLPEFICRYAFLNGLRSLLAKSNSSPRIFFKALLWVMVRTPSLIRERYARPSA